MNAPSNNTSASNTTAATTQQPLEIYKTTAFDLYAMYESNEVATDMLLKGKMVEIRGIVKDITKDGSV